MTKYSDKASAIKNKLDAKYNKATYSQTVASNAEGAYEIGKITVDGTQTTIYGQNTQGSISPGTFTDLQTLITNATAPSGQIPVIILDKDYKYDSTTDSSLSSGIKITKNIIIIGNGHIIDGNNYARAFIDTNGYTWELNDLKIQNCTSENDNEYDLSDGGAIFADDNSQININNTNINNNNANNGDGGAIYADTGATVNINNTQFNQNNANYGGAISTWGGATVNINNTTFKQNTANGYGGAISNYGTLNIKEVIIKNNQANNYANIFSNNSIIIYNCDINDISTTCYKVTNKNYLTDHQSIKTINNESIIGTGNITISGGITLADVDSEIEEYFGEVTDALNEMIESELESTHIHIIPKKNNTEVYNVNLDDTITIVIDITDGSGVALSGETVNFACSGGYIISHQIGTNGTPVTTGYTSSTKTKTGLETSSDGIIIFTCKCSENGLINYIVNDKKIEILVNDSIIDNLTTNDNTKALSAKQGKILYDMIAGIENDMLS